MEFVPGQTVKIWITGLVGTYTARVIESKPLKLRVISGPNDRIVAGYMQDVVLRDEDFIIKEPEPCASGADTNTP